MLQESQPDVAGEVDAFGERKSIAEWASAKGLTVRSLKKRLTVLPPETALSLPPWARLTRLTIPGGEPLSWTWDYLPWKRDIWAQHFVATHPGGALLEEVGDALGITRERVRQIEQAALRKLKWGGEQRKLIEALQGVDEIHTWRWRGDAPGGGAE